MHAPQQHYCLESKPKLQYSDTPDNHGVNPADGPTGLSTHRLGLARG
jgi:hypothetical protein